MQMDEARHSTLAILARRRMWGRGAGGVYRGRRWGRPDAAYPQTLVPGLWGSHPGLACRPGSGLGGCRANRPALDSASEGRDDLRPDRNHAQKQRQRGERGSFFNDGPNHDPTPAQQEQDMNIVHDMFQVKRGVGISQKRDRGVGTERVSPAPKLKESRLGRCPTRVAGGAHPRLGRPRPRHLYRIDHHRKIDPDRATGRDFRNPPPAAVSTPAPRSAPLGPVASSVLSGLFWPLP